MSDKYLDENDIKKEQLLQVQQISYFLRNPNKISKYSRNMICEMIKNNPDMFVKALHFNSERDGSN
jgi:hypothetical protein